MGEVVNEFKFIEDGNCVEWWSRDSYVDIGPIGHYDNKENKWVHYHINGKTKTWYINGVKYPETNFTRLNWIVFKIRYLWKFKRHIKN